MYLIFLLKNLFNIRFFIARVISVYRHIQTANVPTY